MATLKRKIPKKIKKTYKIDDVTYESKALYDFHVECERAYRRGLISSFEIPKNMGKKSRYTTYKPVIDKIKFDSMMEARYYLKLLKDKADGIIEDFKLQYPFCLQPKFKKNGKTFRGIEYVCDFFIYINKDDREVIDIKGKETVEFKIKRKLFEYKYPELSLKVIQYYEPSDEWLELDEIKKLIRKKKKEGADS